MKKKLVKTFFIITVNLSLLYGIASIYINRIHYLEKKYSKFKKYYNLLNEWMKQDESNNSIKNYLTNYNYKNIAIYGLGEIGQRLYHCLLNNDINILYGIDENVESYLDLMIIDPSEVHQIKDKVDIIIVTSIADFESIKKTLNVKCNIPVLSLEEIIFNM